MGAWRSPTTATHTQIFNNMKIKIFETVYKLNTQDVETLKVALLDACKQCEYERSLLNDDDKQLFATMTKIKRLDELAQKLELKDVSLQDVD